MHKIKWCVDISGKLHQILGLGLHFYDVDWNETLKLNKALKLKENATC